MSARSNLIRLALLISAATSILIVATATPTSTPRSSHPALASITFDPNNPVWLAAFGDSGTRTDSQTQIATALTEDGPYDAILHTGDLIYPEGDLSLASDTLDAPYRALANTPWIAAPGNHDSQSGVQDQILAHLGDPPAPYRMRVGPVSVYVFDSFKSLDGQLTWLRDQTLLDTAPFKIALTHAPAFTCSKHRYDDAVTAARDRLMPALDEAGFTVLLSGHDHAYQRFTRPGHATQIVTGGGGADLYSIEECPTGVPNPDVAESVHHYLTIGVTRTSLVITAQTADGRVIDRIEYSN